jgi:hypothetical protein
MGRRVRSQFLLATVSALALGMGCYYDKFTKVGEVDDDDPTGGSSQGGGGMGGVDGSGGSGGGQTATGGETGETFTLPDRHATTAQGTSVVVNLMAGLDSEANFESASDESDGVPENLKGDFSASNNGVLTFTPQVDFWGIYEGSYTVTSPGGVEVSANIRIVVVPKTIDLSVIEGGYGGFVIDGGANYRLGESLAGANVDGDDFDDLILGAPGPSGATGRVAVLRGGDALSSLDLAVDTSPVQLFIGDGNANGRNAGAAVSGGDLNDDGIDDIVIGAPGSAAGNHGRVYVRYGTSAFSAPGADINLNNTPGATGFTVVGSSNYARTGRSVAVAELNGTGGSDLLLTTFEVAAGVGLPGMLRGFVAPPASNPPVESSDFSFAATTLVDAPNSIAAVGDNIGDDDRDEILFSMNGRIILLIGGATWPADMDAFTAYSAGSGDGWIGSTAAANANKQVAAAGRFDSAVGFDMAHCDGVNQCRIVSWTAPDTFSLDTGWLITGLTGGIPRVAGGGDINGDGFDDLIFSHPSGAYVVWGRATVPSTNQDVANLDDHGVTHTPTTPDAIGEPAFLGDINGDGLSDYAIPVPDFDGGRGRVYVVFGTPATAQ